MPYTPEQIEEKLTKELEAEYVKAEDMSDGCGAKYNCIIVSKQFEGKPLLARHRLVNSTLETEMKDIHAFSMKTWTPEQFEKEKAKHS